MTLHTHLRMDGAWRLYRPGQPWRRDPAFQVRAVLETRPWTAVGVRLGLVELLPTAREEEALGHLGPDVLGPDWDEAEAVRRLVARPDRPLGEALIDQSVMAGPGNIYRSEACFLAGIHPWTPVGEVADPGAVVRVVKRLMEANRDAGGQVTTGDPRPGRRHWVYGRRGEACRRCGTPVAKGVQGRPGAEAVAYWCRSCQRGGGPATTS